MKWSESLSAVARSWRPRLLTQLDRDPRSPSYGCGDRDWWHYKIRDFPSIFLQQAGYSTWCLSEINDGNKESSALNDLALGSLRFWSLRVGKRKSFDEYYPWEQGYPPAAFSSLAMVRLAAESTTSLDGVRAGIFG